MAMLKEVAQNSNPHNLSKIYLKYTITKTLSLLFPKVVTLPSVYRSRVLGLCGNYDGNKKNEYTKPDGTVARKLDEFGDSWRVSDKEVAVRTASLPKMVHLHKYGRLRLSVTLCIINQLG